MRDGQGAAAAAAPTGPARGTQLVRALGLWDSVSLITGIMVGSGIFLMAGSIARELHSLAAVAAVWAFGGLLSVCGAVALAELGAALPEAGGLYVYLARAFGPRTGFVYGWSAMALIHSGSLAALAAAIGLYAGPIFDLSVAQQKLLQLGCIALFVAVNSAGVTVGKWVQNALTALKVAGIAWMTVMLYSRGSLDRLWSHWSPSSTADAGAAMSGIPWLGFGVALVAVLWAYDGWHFLSFAAGEVKQPERTIPRSLLLGTVLVFVVYLVVNAAYYAVLSPEAIRGSDRVAALAVQEALGPGAAVSISLLIVVSILGTMNGITLGAARVTYAMAADGLFFRAFARIHPRTHAPVVATVAQGIFAALFTLVGTFQQLFTSFVFTSWIFYGLAVAAVLVLRRREPDLPRPYRCPWYPVTPVFFLLATAGIIVSTFVASFWPALLGVGLIFAGVPLYFAFQAFERRSAPAARE
ncbi:MAG: amino acid permease [Thermoanaerobaculia bacterium]